MTKLLCLLLTAGMMIMLTGCCMYMPESVFTDPPVTTEEITEPPTTQPLTLPPETTVPTLPAHSEFYVPGVSTEDMITYFNEVVLSMEYTDGDGDASLVQKWVSPIFYRIEGDPTEEDMAVLNDLFDTLNAIDGFPGFQPASDTMPEDMTIRFLDRASFNLAFSDTLHGETADGAAQFWYYNDTNIIYTARIGYRTDIDQAIRNSVIIEEIINCLGFNDTELRPDSIVYQYGSDVTRLSDIDLALIRLLYHPEIRCGMDVRQCREVLLRLYY